MSKIAFPEGYFGKKRKEGEFDVKKTLSSMQRYKKKYLVSFIEKLPKNAQVLDVGCGKGKAIELIKGLRPDVTVSGCDITDTSEFLPLATPFVQCGVEDLVKHYREQSYDAVICLHVIEHLVDPIDMMNGFLYVLKSDGRMFIETPNWTRLFIPFSRLYFWNDYTHVHPYCRRSFTRLFSEFGLEAEKVVSVSSVDHVTLIKSFVKRTKNKEFNPAFDNSSSAFKVPIRKSIWQKLFDGFVEFTINPFTKDILIGVGKKTNR